MHGEKMVMERLVMERLERHLTSPSKPDSPLQTLASARALILHPDTSSSTHRAVLDTLARILSHEQATTPLIGHAIKLLGEVAVVDRSLPQSVIGTVRSLLSSGKRVASEALAFFISIAESGGGGGASSLVKSVFDLDLVFSLASSHVVAVRSLVPRLLLLDLSAGDGFSPFQPRLSVLLGLTADLYPSVRRAALDGLVALYKDAGAEANASEVEACYNRAVVLLRDDDELVRLSAVLLIGECGQLLSATKEAVYDGERSDRVFLQLCSMARDMNMKIRVDAFATLGKAKMVSETILLQSLSKKVLKSKSGGNSLFACTVKESKLPLSCVAGVFVHGLEDEYYQVRKAACKSLGMLTMMSLQFANEALNLLMDMLNDDAMAVQLQTLQALFHMATHDRLMLQEKHMHMFLGTLADVSTSIRCASREVLQVLKVPNMGIFESSVNGILTNLEKFPEDEKDVLLVLYFVGKNHGKFAAHFVSTLLQELELNEGDLKLDRPRVAALLMLAISSTFSSKKLTYDIPERIFSYAVSLLGRFSCSLVGVMNQDTLLAHLFQHTRMCFSDTKSNVTEGELLSHAAEVGIFSYTMNPDGPDQICSSAWPGHDANLEMNQVSAPLVQFQLKKAFADEEITHAIKPVLRTAADTWPLIQSSCTDEVLRTLRTCSEELELVDQKVNGCFDAWLSFALQYVQVIQLIAQVWEQMRPRGIHIVGMNKLDFLLEKLDVSLRKMRYGFSGLSKEEECHILELILLCYVVRLSRIGLCSHTLSKRLQATISRLEYICEGLTHLSVFVKETRNLFCQRGEDEAFSPFDENSLLQLFSIERILFSGRFKLLKAELQVPCNDSENPLPFISGLPVGITFHITLYNISDHCRLWLSMTVDESIQHAFLDVSRFEGTHELRKCIINVPFYWTPKVVSFQLKACVVLECPSECVTQWKGHRGPKYETTYLCESMDVYLVRIENV